MVDYPFLGMVFFIKMGVFLWLCCISGPLVQTESFPKQNGHTASFSKEKIMILQHLHHFEKTKKVCSAITIRLSIYLVPMCPIKIENFILISQPVIHTKTFFWTIYAIISKQSDQSLQFSVSEIQGLETVKKKNHFVTQFDNIPVENEW